MIQDLKEFCRLFYATTYIPIVLHSPRHELFCYPEILKTLDINTPQTQKKLSFHRNPDYMVTDSFSYIGYIQDERSGDFLIIGPVFSTPVSDSMILNFMHEWAIPSDYHKDIALFFSNTPLISFHQFLNTLSCLSLCLNDREETFEEFREGITNATSRTNIASHHIRQLFESRENKSFHNSYHFEQQMTKYVQEGNTSALRVLLEQQSSGISTGTVAENALRQEKNIFITTIALICRSAVAGGMTIEEAYGLSDVYLKECERLQDIPSISALAETAIFDFTERVSKSKKIDGISKEVFDCVQFINRHTHENIQVADVAEHIGRSRSYISNKFKEELGFDISRFIMRCKLEEAKSLLTYSERTLSEISSYLCFSSQSYFQNVFKKKYGVTPKEYRSQSRRKANNP